MTDAENPDGPTPKGRKPFKPSAKHRKNVMNWKGARISEPIMAKMLGICQNTLRKHFERELNEGAEMARAANIVRLVKAADGNNVAAMKHLDAKFTIAAATDAFEANSETPALKPTSDYVGKKEIRQIQAATAGEGTEWENDLRPPGAPVN